MSELPTAARNTARNTSGAKSVCSSKASCSVQQNGMGIIYKKIQQALHCIF